MRDDNVIRTFAADEAIRRYREKPVDPIVFLRDDKYLGKATRNLKAIYTGWLDVIVEIFRNDTRYQVVFTGSIGVGKTTIAVYCIAYILYRILLLRDPWFQFQKADIGKMAVSFFNLTKSLSNSKGYMTLMSALSRSEWFKQNGMIVRETRDMTVDIPLFEWALSSPYAKGFGTVSKDVIAGLLDEVDSPTESAGSRKRVLQAYESTIRRFESRFVLDGTSIGRLFLVASKQDELSFLDVFIEEMKSTNKVIVFDKSQWDIFPKTYYCGIRFPVSVGDAYNPPKILTTEADKLREIKEGYKIIEVPIEHKFDFERDIVGALRDLAGVSVKGLRKYKLFPSERFITACFDETKPDPVAIPTYNTGLLDEVPWINLVDMAKIRLPGNVPRCIHLDISFAGDAMALACSGICGWIEADIEKEEGTFVKEKVPIVETDFILRVKARDGDRIPLHQMRRFILDLRAAGLNVAKFTADLLLASEDTMQILTKSKIETEYFSVDKDIKGYVGFRDLVFERRWICHEHAWLFFELKNVEFDRDKNKIDHPDKVKDIEILGDGTFREMVMNGSKDVADAVVASVHQCILMAKVPFDMAQSQKMLRGLSAPKGAESMPDGWFVDKKSTGGVEVLVNEEEKFNKMRAALKNLRGLRGV